MKPWLRAVVFITALIPFLVLFIQAIGDRLGPDPGEVIMHVTGEWAIRLLVLTLLASPVKAWFGWSGLLLLRRMLGLYTFFYGCIHLLTFAHFYTGWEAVAVISELVERPYIAVGFAAWLAMLPLAITSTKAMQRRLKRRWLVLHRLVYGTAALACLHLLWQARSDIGDALIYSVVLGSLLLWRVHRARKRAVVSC